jgi:NADPH:quinone reductase-like Zn-dependent oxidoreductase
MKAVFCPSYGLPNVLEEREIEHPTLSDTEILIQTWTTSVTAGDCRVRAMKMPIGFGLIGRLALGVLKPRQPILGSELAGVVVALGKNVTKFKVGDEVILYTGTKLGCHTELKAVDQDGPVIAKPRNITFQEAAGMASSGTTALSFLRRGGVQKGSNVLVVGASGGVGSAAVMLAKHLGAHVTAVSSAANAGFVLDLGADEVIDYANEDFAKGKEKYDAILDASGSVSYLRARRTIKKGGTLLLVSANLPQMLGAALAPLSKHKVLSGPASWTQEDLIALAKATEAGTYRVPIDRTFPFEQIADAHAYVDTGRKRGNVVISMKACADCS